MIGDLRMYVGYCNIYCPEGGEVSQLKMDPGTHVSDEPHGDRSDGIPPNR